MIRPDRFEQVGILVGSILGILIAWARPVSTIRTRLGHA